MANTYTPVEMDIGSSRTVIINVRSDVATYFGITASTTASEAVVTRRRKAHSRNRFDGLTDTTATSTNVSASEWKAIKKTADIGSGKLIRIPTKLTSGTGDKQNIRYTSIRVPGNANIASVSKFLYDKCDAAKRPSFFITQAGARYPVVNVTGDVNPGDTEPTTP
ncbi:MAG: hypothetical protein HC836_24760 [Richelia sp. RM2_1_2]|nr:hypothetical protein [Richelia sp. RM1_1_1]NJO61347.1 hypothetical protein [Richelia sp. RM2_1_2]